MNEIQRLMKKNNFTDDDIIQWANEQGYSKFSANMKILRQMFLTSRGVKLEYPELDMRGKRLAIADVEPDEWCIITVLMGNIVRERKFDMCPVEDCYKRLDKENGCPVHGWAADAFQGYRHIYMAGDDEGDTIFVIVPAKYAMNGYNFTGKVCDIKGVFNPVLEGFYANLIIPVDGDSNDEKEDDSQSSSVSSLPEKMDTSMFNAEESKDEEINSKLFDTEHSYFLAILRMKNVQPLSDFEGWRRSNGIHYSIEEFVKATPGCKIEGKGNNRRVVYSP